jgi:hypothetical protein
MQPSFDKPIITDPYQAKTPHYSAQFQLYKGLFPGHTSLFDVLSGVSRFATKTITQHRHNITQVIRGAVKALGWVFTGISRFDVNSGAVVPLLNGDHPS